MVAIAFGPARATGRSVAGGVATSAGGMTVRVSTADGVPSRSTRRAHHTAASQYGGSAKCAGLRAGTVVDDAVVTHNAHMPTMTRITRTTAALVATLGLGTTMLLAPMPARAADSPTKMTIAFDGAKLTGLPATLKGGLNEITVNNTAKFAITLQLAHINGTHTDAEIKALAVAGTGPTKWVEGVGGTGTISAGKSNVAIVNLDKGNHLWLVFSNGGELDGPKAPFGRFTVNGAKSATQPSGVASIKTKEYGFETSGLKAGVNRVTFSNVGKEWHHAVIEKIKAGKTIDDVKKEMASNLQGPPQTVEQTGGDNLPLINPGVTMATDITLSKGSYAFVCFMPDAKGKPHVMDGMIQEVKIA